MLLNISFGTIFNKIENVSMYVITKISVFSTEGIHFDSLDKTAIILKLLR